MQSVKEAEFLYITFLLVLFTAAPAAAMFGTVMVPLTRMYASHKFYLILDILNLKLLLSSFSFIIYFNPISCSKIRWLIHCII